MNIESSLDLLPDYKKTYNPKLERYIETFMTKSRISSLKRTLKNRTKHLTLVAESLIDEHNIHAMIRSSECFGLQDFHNITDPKAHLKPSRSVSRGSFQWTHSYNYSADKVPSLEAINHLKSKGYKVYASSSNIKSNFTPQTIPIDKPIAIIMGNEHNGISQTALDSTDGIISIPMYGFTESFNVSVAASLLLQPIIDRIRNSELNWQLTEEEMKNIYFEWIWNGFSQPDNIYKEWLLKKSVET